MNKRIALLTLFSLTGLMMFTYQNCSPASFTPQGTVDAKIVDANSDQEANDIANDMDNDDNNEGGGGGGTGGNPVVSIEEPGIPDGEGPEIPGGNPGGNGNGGSCGGHRLDNNKGCKHHGVEDIKKVIVNVDHIELWGVGGKLLDLAPNLGEVDLVKVENVGLLLPADATAPSNLRVHHIRLILKDSGHYIVLADDSQKEVKTPSFKLHINLCGLVDYDAKQVHTVKAWYRLVHPGHTRFLVPPPLKLISLSLGDGRDDF